MYRALLVLGLIVASAVLLMPSLTGGDLPGWWKSFLPTQQVRLGLDLQGGSHIVLTVEIDKALGQALEQIAGELQREAKEAGIEVALAERRDSSVAVRLQSREDVDKFKEFVADRFPILRQSDTTAEEGQTVLLFQHVPQEDQRLREFALDQTLETIRNRIDQFGVTEPVIVRQGESDILIQLPGIQEPERAKELIGRTALLEFKLLEGDETDPEQYKDGKKALPPNTQLLSGPEYDALTGTMRRVWYVVHNRALMTGDVIADARVRPAFEAGEGPTVDLSFNARGAKLFDEVTAANVGRRLAIVLDNSVYSAPVIRERISGGRATISGSFDLKEARDLAIVLRAGALPAPVVISEERTVGPTLGRDSIRQGFTSFLVGGFAVMVFMVFYYRFGGILADTALVLNVFFLMAAMAALGTTLTLPGIAGIVLTLGMAVDANVLISERIREEVRLGKTARAAVEAGYERALPAVLDSNITTFLAGVILFNFGSGPIRGFAVTLCLGIVSSVFTAVVCTRLVYDYLLTYRRLQTLSV